jgi:DNA-binding SARP family transcriptional activator/tetratricopeptide (TPR) repeat protein
VRYQILGPVELLDAQGRLGGPKQRTVLALLLLNANRVVSEQRFVSVVWGDEPPPSVRGQLQMYVSQLRKLIGAPVIVRRPPGYLIRVAPGELDLQVFDDAVWRARADLSAGRPEDAATGLRRAITLWQDPILGGTTELLLAREEPMLRDRLLGAREEYFDAGLRAGQHGRLVRELRAAAEENPLRERLWAQLMLALHESGRTAEALDVYAATQSLLMDTKGVDPGPVLRDTHARLLREDDRATPVSEAPVPRQLPADLPVFAGRTAELALLAGVLPPDGDPSAPVVVIGGGAGMGKTTLAVHWAHQVAGRFPDGQLYANLRGFDPGGHQVTPDEVVRGFLGALGVPAAQVPADADARFGRYRDLLAGRRMLVVLDNARDAEHVRPLLPASPGCLAVVTSRHQLPSLIVAGAVPATLGLLSAGETRDLLARRLGPVRVDAEPETVAEIGELCARLPLALAIVAARAATNPDFSLASLREELTTVGGLDAFETGDPAANVRAVFSWSYLTLSEPAARLFRLLGLHPGPHATVVAAAGLLGVPVRDARALLGELARAQLIVESSPGRHGFHDLLRAYASELAHTEEPSDVRHDAIHRLLDHYTHTAWLADRLLRPLRKTPVTPAPAPDGVVVGDLRTDTQAVEWFAAEHEVLYAAIEQAARHGFDTHAWQLAVTLPATQAHGGARWLGTPALYETALTAGRRLGDPVALALTHRARSLLHLTLDQLDDAETELRAALALSEEIGDHALLADVHQGLGALCTRTGRYAESYQHAERILESYEAMGNQLGVAAAYNNLAWCLVQLDDSEQAVTLCEKALEMFEGGKSDRHEAHTWDTLGQAHRRLGHEDEAISCFRRSIELFRKVNTRYAESDTLREIGDIYYERGALAEARKEWQEALAIVEELQLTSRADVIRERLARCSTVRSASSANVDT